jgi:hypothetical protein
MTNTYESAGIFRSSTGPWSTTDEAFFRIAAELFAPAFLQGATVLLSSYDPAPTAAAAPA